MRAVVLFLLFACACVAAPAAAVCGDNKVSGSETCDVGATTDPACISCRVQPGYECRNTYNSASTCYIKHGDGIVTVSTDARYSAQSEECDDGNSVGKDGCSPVGKLEPGFYCDASVAADPVSPKVACGQSGTAEKPHPFCGDGIVAWPETCDLGGGVAQWPYGTDWANEGNWGCWQCNLVKGWLCNAVRSNGDVTVTDNICNTPRGSNSWDTTTPCCGRNCGDGLVAGGERCDDGEYPITSGNLWKDDGDDCPGCRYPSEDDIHDHINFVTWGSRNPTGVSVDNRVSVGGYRGTAPADTASPYWACANDRYVYGALGSTPFTSRYDNLATVTGVGLLDQCTCQTHTTSPAASCTLAQVYQGSGVGVPGFTYNVCMDIANEYACGTCTNRCTAPVYSSGCGTVCCDNSCSCGTIPDPMNCCCYYDSTSCRPTFTSCTGTTCNYAGSCPSTRCGGAITCYP